MRLATVLLVLSAFTVSAQDKKFVPLPTGPAPNFNPREAEGAFDILVYVDGEAFLYVKDTTLNYLPLSGAPIRNAGTNYSHGVPRAVFGSFNVVKKAGSGDVDLYEEPSPKNDYTAVIRVTDHGFGIPPAMLTRIFEPFLQIDRTLERSQGGLGIGLTLVKQIVEIHGGQVEAASDGHG